MASSPTPSPAHCSVQKHVTCTICMETFEDPVTTSCGHTFCKKCLHCNFDYNDQMCPLCKQYLNRSPDVNIVLRNIIDELRKTPEKDDDECSGAPGEVPCDVCTTETNLKAEKSCLVCLASYCSAHLKNHSLIKRLKGHKLVDPVENLDERACLNHGLPLGLYSRKQQKCICVHCMEEGQEEVVSTERERDKKMADLDETNIRLDQKIRERKSKVDEINACLKNCMDQLDTEWREIDGVFTAVMNAVEQAQKRALQPLKDRRTFIEKEANELIHEVEAEISKLEAAISELGQISVLEDHILFLQRYPLLQDLDDVKDWTEVELDTSLCFGTMRKTTTAMLKQIQQELEKLTSTELRRLPKFAVDVKLDPTTAHRRLVVSDDGKQVKDGGEIQEVPEAPERFDLFGSVLGLNSLTSEKSYWEVEVSNKTGWDLGVTRGNADRRGKLSLNPENGYWVTVHYEDKEYAALTAPPMRLSLIDKPQKVGVFVDYEEGLVSFYDVTAESHIYSFTECAVKDGLFPYFSPHFNEDEKNSAPLTICTEKHGQQSVIAYCP